VVTVAEASRFITRSPVVPVPPREPLPSIGEAVRALGEAVGTSKAIITIATRLAGHVKDDFDDRDAVAAGALYIASREARKPITTGALAARCKTTRARFNAAIRACAHFA